ncbi:MAG: ATP-binding protein [Candidatus Hydrothermota bacterium]|nr:MAG: ATP-binding protein [Candidatus Hydrothermae bacterium]
MRYIAPYVVRDLGKKMVFIGGPRQVGKTTLALAVLDQYFPSGRYFNWDFDEDRRAILKKQWRQDNTLLIFDELHKFSRWKQWIKGIYDITGSRHSILITGSARLDVYRRGGDSLMGRYHYWRLHPFTLDELPDSIGQEEAFDRLMTMGGFPEPFLVGDEREARRWRKERFDRVIREDIRDLEGVHDLQTLHLLLDLLRERVGSTIVIANIAEDLQVAHKTVKRWLDVLERMYLIFVVRPYVRSGPRSVLKPPKVYFFDNGDVLGDEGARFENLVACSLLKRIHFLEDREGYRYQLCYIRDKDGREVDFAVVKDGVPQELIEVKYSDEKISRGLRYYATRLKPLRAVQIVATIKNPYDEKDVSVVGPLDYLSTPPWGNSE